MKKHRMVGVAGGRRRCGMEMAKIKEPRMGDGGWMTTAARPSTSDLMSVAADLGTVRLIIRSLSLSEDE